MKRIDTATRANDLFGVGKHGFKDGNLGLGILPTDFDASICNNLQEELANQVEGAGIVLDGNVRTQVAQAIKRLAGANVTSVTFAMSPFALTADHAGLVLVDCSGGNVVLNLPAANVVTALPIVYVSVKTEASANTATFNRAGANLIDGANSFALTTQYQSRTIRSNAVDAWATVSQYSLFQAAQQPGEVCYFARNTAPTGFVKANGAAISRTVYATLFSAIGTTFGVGDGATTFNVPDLRAEFVRGWDDGRGIDTGRVFGTAQADDIRSHTHLIYRNSAFNSVTGGPTLLTDGEAATQSGAFGGTETRPRNVALLACIKF